MGTCYTYLLYDDFDWGFGNPLPKEETIRQLKEEIPVATIEAQWPHYIVIDLEKNSPWGEIAQKLKKYCDKAYYYGDSSEYDIQPVEFKKTEEEIREEVNQPQNRNAKEIEEAYNLWKENYENLLN